MSAKPTPRHSASITVAMIVCNEQEHIAAAIESARLVEPVQILVVDSGSKDDTAAIAENLGARVIYNPWPGYVAQRNFAMKQCSSEWILFIDADERITEPLGKELCAYAKVRHYDGVKVRRHNWFVGKSLRCTREAIYRMCRVHQGSWKGGLVHEALQIKGKTVTSRNHLEHYAWPTLEDFTARHLAYARLMGEQRARSGKRVYPWDWCRGVYALFKVLLIQYGLFDGWRGWLFAWANAIYTTNKVVHHYYYRRILANQKDSRV